MSPACPQGVPCGRAPVGPPQLPCHILLLVLDVLVRTAEPEPAREKPPEGQSVPWVVLA